MAKVKTMCRDCTLVLQIYYRYSALGSVWAETRVQSGVWYGSGTLYPGQVLRVVCHCFPPRLDFPTFATRCLHVRHDARDPSSGRWNFGRECCLVMLPKLLLPRHLGVFYVGNSISKLQIQFATYVFELSAGNCHR